VTAAWTEARRRCGKTHHPAGVPAGEPAARKRSRGRKQKQRAQRIRDESGDHEQDASEESECAVQGRTTGPATLRHRQRHPTEGRAPLDTQKRHAKQRGPEQQHSRQKLADRETDLDEDEHLDSRHGQQDKEEHLGTQTRRRRTAVGRRGVSDRIARGCGGARSGKASMR
jgi:hypothetical protein